jgi:hypothetical protein
MSKFTAGPWQHIGDPEDDECRVRQTASVRRGDGFYSEITICENIRSKGNANLIAAAPDLLAALEAVLSVADRATLEFDLARAAIAKARGQS